MVLNELTINPNYDLLACMHPTGSGCCCTVDYLLEWERLGFKMNNALETFESLNRVMAIEKVIGSWWNLIHSDFEFQREPHSPKRIDQIEVRKREPEESVTTKAIESILFNWSLRCDQQLVGSVCSLNTVQVYFCTTSLTWSSQANEPFDKMPVPVTDPKPKHSDSSTLDAP